MKRIENNFMTGLIVYAVIGCVLGWMLFSLVGSLLFSAILVIITIIVGYITDFKNIHITETVAIVNDKTESKVGWATGQVVWMMFGVYRIDAVQDNTLEKISITITEAVSMDGLTIKKAEADVYYQLADIYVVTYKIGKDAIEILTKKSQDAAEAALKNTNLKDVEKSAANDELGEKIKNVLANFFIEKGFNYMGSDFRGIETSDAYNKSRELLQIEEGIQNQKDFIDAQFMGRVNRNHLYAVLKYVRGFSFDDIIVLAMTQLHMTKSPEKPEDQIKLINKAVQIAEDKSGLEGKVLKKMHKQALEDLNIRERDIKKDIFENRGNGGAHPIVSIK